MDFFGSNNRTTLEVTFDGRTHSLEGDDAVLFQAKAQAGRPFEFTFPGDSEATQIDFNGLHTATRTTVVQD
ncbi:MAG TPA: hypothetical protein VIP82_20890 [Microbacterium sp.]|uniref:hypothetical protein n=1 Tax=Microbacterium sp. TaxID=51671 RepID=UPI002F958EBB